MKSIALLVGVGSLALTPLAFAGGVEKPQASPNVSHGWYIGANAGSAWLISTQIPNASDSVIATSGQVGYRFNQFRIESEFGYSRDTDAGLNFFSTMINGIYDFNLHGKLKPYIGIGAGYTHFSGNNIFFSSSGAFSYQALAGLNYALNRKVSIGIGYKIMSWTGNPYDLYRNSLTIGVSYSFK